MAATVESLREYLLTRHGTDYGVPDDVLVACLDRARAYLAELRLPGDVHSIAAGYIRNAAAGPTLRR